MSSKSTAVRLGDATLAEFSAGLSGRVFTASDPEYDDARAIWNGAHDRRPAAVVRCAGVADVMNTIDLARSEGVALAVRAGGHSIPGFSTCDDGIVLDLSLMRGMRVDPNARRVTIQTGCVWRDVDSETQQFNLAVTGGLVSSTGVAGFTLGGGIGWLTRQYGLTVDNLVSADVITADGQWVNTRDDPDLLWGLQGGGGNFGVATSLELALHDVGPAVFAGLVFYPAEAADAILRGYHELCGGAPDGLTTLLKLTTAPTAPFIPDAVRETPVVVIGGCWVGDPAEAAAVTRPFRSLAPAIADTWVVRGYPEWQRSLDAQFPRGLHCYFRSAFLAALDDPAVETLVHAHAGLPNVLTEIIVHQLGGAAGRVPPTATAFAIRDHDYIVNVIARTSGPAGFDGVRQWSRDLIQALAPAGPTYVNFTGEAGADHVRAAYPAETYRRLVDLKSRYDPDNLFRLNQNIPPARAG